MPTRDPHTVLIADELEQRGYTVAWLTNWSISARRGQEHHTFWGGRSPLNTQTAAMLCRRKDINYKLLDDAGVRFPRGLAFHRDRVDNALRYARRMERPVVVKPAASPGHGKGATPGLRVGHTRGVESFRKAFARAGRVYPWVLVQRHVSGIEARMLVIGGRCVHVLRKLAREGDYEAITERVHPSYLRAAEAAVAAIPGLGLAGLDVIAEDWTRPGPYWVIEVNSAPGIKGHHAPRRGSAFDAAGAIVDEVEMRARRARRR
jgi:glutathione synthase/RimK-type ligase-like ATP-grasp enzyme